MRTLLAFSAAFLLAACGKDSSSSSGSSSSSSSSARRISGGKENSHKGVLFDVPGDWQVVDKGQVLVLNAPNMNPKGELEEAYFFGGDVAVKTVEGSEFERMADKSVKELVPTAERKGSWESKTCGELPGRAAVYSAKTPDGREVQVRVWGFVGANACILAALGYADVLDKRDSVIQEILGSIRKAPAPEPGTAGAHEELAGKWFYMVNIHANNGGRQTGTFFTLNKDGSYVWKSESVSDNPFGAAWSSETDTGTWSATDTTLTFNSSSGRSSTYKLEKRNHPKNTGDPMLVLDGKAFVTATLRKPW